MTMGRYEDLSIHAVVWFPVERMLELMYVRLSSCTGTRVCKK